MLWEEAGNKYGTKNVILSVNEFHRKGNRKLRKD